MDKKKIDENVVKETIAELEASEGRSAEKPHPVDQAGTSRQAEKPKEPRITGPQLRKTKGLGFLSLIFWVYVLLLSGILTANFVFLSNDETQNLKPSSTVRIRKPISAAEQMK